MHLNIILKPLLLLLGIFISISLQAQNCATQFGTIFVTNTNDTGDGSLREAINCANNTPGGNTIRFAIPGTGDQIIYIGSQSASALPTITDANTIIDGSTQDGYGPFPVVILDGSQYDWTAPIDAILMIADNCEIIGLEVRNFPDDGLDVQGGDDCIIRDNIIYNCGWELDTFPGYPGLSWEGCGIVIREGADNCTVNNNFIGTDENLTVGLGNEWCGILLRTNSDGANISDNIIAYNEVGIVVSLGLGNDISQNSIYCNNSEAITLVNSGNSLKVPPIIGAVTATAISGQGDNGDVVEVYANSNSCTVGCQAEIYLGSATVSNSTWTLSAPYSSTLQANDIISAIARDIDGNTSEVSGCVNIVNTSSCADGNGNITVTNTNDEGNGSLREAITCANSDPGANTIRFNIPGNGKQYIHVGETSGDPLPPITDAYTIIDATTQGSFGNNGNYDPLIVLDGQYHSWTGPYNAVFIREANYCEVYGLEIVNFPDDGIDATDSDFTIIGDINKGNVIYNCGSVVDYFPDAPNTGPWEGCAVVLKLGSSNCQIKGNYLGTDYNQNITIGNEYCGVIIRDGGDNNEIGGTNAGEANIIANNPTGVLINSNSSDCSIHRNILYCNQDDGIRLDGNANNNIDKPTVSGGTINVVYGQAITGGTIEVFISNNAGCINAACQGLSYLGSATSVNGSWSLTAPFANGISLSGGEVVTATVTLNNNTSEFAVCAVVLNQSDPECDISFGISDIRNESCHGNDGQFNAVVLNGTPPYTFDIGNGPNSSGFFTGLVAGTYIVVAEDAEGCMKNLSVTLSQSSSPVASITNVVDTNCGQLGSFTAGASGGTSPYLYNFGSGNTSDPNHSNLTTGTYTVTITDDNGCTDTESITIRGEGNISIIVTGITDAACDEDNGFVSVSSSGGLSPYVYNIGNGNTSNPNFSNLAMGTYLLTVTDANNCTATRTIVIGQTEIPMLFIDNLEHADCGDSGTFEVFLTSSYAPFTYDIGNGPTSNSIFSSLSSGIYAVTVSDRNGCTATEDVTIEQGENAISSFSGSIVHESCNQSNGSFTVFVTGGTSPFLYDIGFGTTSNATFSNLSAGSYTVTITDSTACATSTEPIIISNTPEPSLGISDIVEVPCGGGGGSFTMSAFNGTEPYLYNIGSGNTSNPTFSDLSPGTYGVTVTDGVGCTATLSVILDAAEGPIATITNSMDASCDDNNGSFIAEVSAGTGTMPYSYDIGFGSTANPVFSNLITGLYFLTVTDANDCSSTASIVIGNTPIPSVGIEEVVNADCGQENGSFILSGINGTPPYIYDIGFGETSNPAFTNLAASTYASSITDFNGCVAELAITVEGGGSDITATVSDINLPDCETTEGSFTVFTSGGSTPYTYDIGDGPTNNSTFSNLSSSNYDVTVTDQNGCTVLVIAELETNTVAPQADFSALVENMSVNLTNLSSNGENYTWNFGDGTIANSASSYSYSATGTYTVCLTATNVACGDDTYCEDITILEIDETMFRFDLGEVVSGTGGTVYIPVYVRNFNNIVGFQKSIHIENTAIGRISTVTNINLQDLYISNFLITDSTIVVSWNDNNIAGISIPDSTIIYMIEVEVEGTPGTCSNLYINNNPLNVEVYQKSGNTEIIIPHQKIAGNICVLSSETASIDGLIYREDGESIALADVHCTNALPETTDLQGIYDFFDLPIANSYTIRPEKDILYLNGVSTYDIGKINEHILGQDTLDSPYKLIAADINNSGGITISDVFALQQLILGVVDELPNSTSWRFVPADYIFPNPFNPFSPAFPESATFTLSNDVSKDFIGVKIGDVNNSAFPEQLLDVEDRQTNPPHYFTTTDRKLQTGEIITIPISTNELNDMGGFQFTMAFNTNKLKFVEILPEADQNVHLNNFGQRYIDNGFLTSSWINTARSNKSNKAVLFQLKFEVLQDGQLSEDLAINSEYTLAEAYRNDDIILRPELHFESVNSGYYLYQNRPNPFSASTSIGFELAKEETVSLRVFDVQGKLILNTAISGKKGYNDYLVSSGNLPSGLLYYKLSGKEFTATKKMIVLK